ncbi:lysophospholipid acyltransferase family protein [Aureispira anguillae]|uniref:Acyltransferase family protein n=1 Tax=Aureispira anguillae TaxID=2864201 RepID=A0A915YI99_9BACT|nr:lysophospholipid acyltransferase family protein [Aureispira anguillae]BDS13700.1 acyltransferase family protein [Aureispira anguillae]
MDLSNRPSDKQVKQMFNLFKPLFWLNDPVFYDAHLIPEKGPVLFVGNHTLLGLWDASIMWFKLYNDKNIFTYSLGDRAHFQIPFWRDLASQFGMVEASRKNCTELMQNQQYTLVFPGGAREAFKNKGEAYKLKWNNRTGFVKMAIEHQCTIVPFSAVGAEECYELVWDSKEILSSPLGLLLKQFGARKDMIIPIVKGVGLTPLPKPQRFYYKFSKPIATTKYKGMAQDEETIQGLKAIVRQNIEEGIDDLLEIRDKDPNKTLFKRILSQMLHK